MKTRKTDTRHELIDQGDKAVGNEKYIVGLTSGKGPET